MKKIILQALVLKNFKGVKEFKLDTQGYNVQVFGDNGTGKTTLFDAFIWLMFDKDSQNKKDFQLKTVDSIGKEINNLEHEVEGIFSVEGTSLSLRKVFKEKWTRKRGAATTEFTGHTTDYYVNGVPSKKKEFTDAVANLIDEDVFKLLTSPLYFNEQLHWQKRRELLLQISGDITNEDVINSNKELASLENILNGKSIEDHRKIITAKRSEINKELTRIPIRIDEVRRGMTDISDLNEAEINERIQKAEVLMMEERNKIAEIRNGNNILDLKGQITFQQAELEEKKFEYTEKNYAALNRKRAEIQALNDKEANYTVDSKKAYRKHADLMSEHAELVEKVDKLRNEWKTADDETFDTHALACSTCGQDLPEDKKQTMLENFNAKKAKHLTNIAVAGKEGAAKVEQLKVEISAVTNEINAIDAEIKEIQRQKQEASQQFEEMKAQTTRFEDTGVYTSYQTEIAALKEQINQIQDTNIQVIQEHEQTIKNLDNEIMTEREKRARLQQVQLSEQRIIELEAEEKELAKEFEDLEHQLYLTEEFIRSKVTLLEEKINSKFKYARFKLFETQINGGLTETCETLYQGVPYSRGLNNAARINVGLDIISTLAEHFNVACSIFIDNSESVTELIDMDTQIISLVVSGTDDELRVEQNQQLNQEAI
ncbi:AAA family ATPase [Priestia sp. SB1]|uniref:AAA family ATPase n=1 Tax=Priestia sp. SB1 TaxID=3132359 RepID=UPI0031756891